MVRFGVITAYEQEDASSRSLLDACERHGEIVAVDPADLRVEVGAGRISVSVSNTPAEEFDAFLLLRGVGADGDADFQLEAYRLLEKGGALVMNGLEPLLCAQDKLRTCALLTEAGVATPAVAVVQRAGELPGALERLGPAVAKPQCGSLGDGVERLEPDAAGIRRAEEILDERKALFLQAWVDHGGRDVRAFVVDGGVEASMERLAPPGEFRTNVSIGGEGREIELAPEVEELAVRATRALGLDWAGVDLAFGPDGPEVIEVNGSPSWRGIGRATGRDMAEAIAAHAARRVSQRGLRRAAHVEGG
ncbi:MAG TPA: RimK family alpha-L-glutamate ligase [Vulgatibacter sp.]|nr:RimK family alpha-L-glutamate ligase [Vulgatibacter sp.]